MIALTASRLQLAAHCLAPFRSLEFVPPLVGAAAQRGTRIHADLAASEPEKQGPRVHIEVTFGWRRSGEVDLLGYDLGRDYPAGWDVVGTADRIEVTDDAVIVTDHKTGSGLSYSARESWQLAFLAMCAARHFGRAKAQGRLNYIDQFRADEAELDLATFEVALLAAIATERSIEPQPGAHCHDLYCPARGVCPAIREQAAAIVPVERLLLSRERGGEALAALCAARHLCDDFKVALEALADELGGIPTAPGKVWRGVPSSRETVAVKDVRAAFGAAAEPLIKRSEFVTYREVKA